MDFRYDINGIRAWAVVFVIFFHFGIAGFDGGYVGVDIFFVISGFLMTQIIMTGLISSQPVDKKPFSLLSFFLARAIRILPALVVLCVVLMILGWFLLPATEYRMLATHAITAVAFISNIIFWREAGYFDLASHEKWLLHTWSLSVEWQFYIAFPIVLLTLWKLYPRRNFIIGMMWLGFLASLFMSVSLTPKIPDASFYLLPTRAWELLAGGLVFLHAHQFKFNSRKAFLIELLGITCLVLSATYFTRSMTWPGYAALLPVGGTVLILMSASNSFFTRNAIAQWLGKVSYSLYLWHWPLAVTLVIMGWHKLLEPTIIALAVTVILGWLSFHWVEVPLRKSLRNMPRFKATTVLAAAVLVVLIFSLLVRMFNGVDGRISSRADDIFHESNNKNPIHHECNSRKPANACTYGGDIPALFVIGDSHAQSITLAASKSLPSNELQVIDLGLSSCATIFGIKDINDQSNSCSKHLLDAFNLTKMHKDIPLLIVNRTSGYIEFTELIHKIREYEVTFYLTEIRSTRDEMYYSEIHHGIVDTACEFAKHRPVYMLRPLPELKLDIPKTMGRSLLYRNEEVRVSISMEEYEQRHRRALAAQDEAAALCGVKLLDPRQFLCSDGHCWGDKDGLPLYYDDNHLNLRGADLLIPLFKQIFEDQISQATD